MRSPSGGEARHRGGTQVGKTPPSPEMTISGLTEGGLSGKIMTPINDFPRLCRTCGPPLRRAVSFLGFRFSCESQIALRHRPFRTVAAPPSSTPDDTQRIISAKQLMHGPMISCADLPAGRLRMTASRDIGLSFRR